jgi:tubulin-specific chaperone D
MERVLELLKRASREYTFDRRGDVGSLVREAAMRTSVEILGHVGVWPEWVNPVLFMRIMVQQALERIDRTRAVAGESLVALLRMRQENTKDFVLMTRVAETLDKSGVLASGVNWSSSSLVFPALVPLIHVHELSEDVWQGLVMSIGGQTESLVRHARTALESELNAVVAQGDVHEARRLLSVFTAVLRANAESERTAMAGLKVLDWLLTSGLLFRLSGLQDAAGINDSSTVDHLLQPLVDVSKSATRGTESVNLISTAVGCLCGFVAREALRRSSLATLMVLLCHKFPRVRRVVSEQLYLVVVADETVCPPETFAEALDILSETCWCVRVFAVWVASTHSVWQKGCSACRSTRTAERSLRRAGCSTACRFACRCQVTLLFLVYKGHLPSPSLHCHGRH